MEFEIYSGDLMTLLIRTLLMIVDSIAVWTESSRKLD